MSVYFIKAGTDGPVKIGTAEDAKKRLGDLQVANHMPLHIIRETAGGVPEERWFHRHFSTIRVRGEWFLFSPHMLTVQPVSAELKGVCGRGLLPIVKLAADAVGGLAKLAETIGVSPQALYQWDRVPADRALAIEKATGERVLREDMRPDIWPRDAVWKSSSRAVAHADSPSVPS